jgi:FlaA1/EpsC-like NDP-sugar epimerase
MKIDLDRNDFFLELVSALNQRRVSSTWNKLMLTTSDLFSLVVSIWLAYGIFQWLTPGYDAGDQRFLAPPLILFGGMYFLSGHYRARNVNPVEELRNLTLTTTIIFVTLFAFNALLVESKYPAAVLAFSWLIAIASVPLARLVVRWLGAKMGIWGEPVVIIGNGSISRKLVQFLIKNPYCGMRPVLVLDGLPYERQETDVGDFPIPVTSMTSHVIPYIPSHLGASTAIIVAPDLPSPVSEAFARGEHLGFSNIITVTSPFNTRNFAGLWRPAGLRRASL